MGVNGTFLTTRKRKVSKGKNLLLLRKKKSHCYCYCTFPCQMEFQRLKTNFSQNPYSYGKKAIFSALFNHIRFT